MPFCVSEKQYSLQLLLQWMFPKPKSKVPWSFCNFLVWNKPVNMFQLRENMCCGWWKYSLAPEGAHRCPKRSYSFLVILHDRPAIFSNIELHQLRISWNSEIAASWSWFIESNIYFQSLHFPVLLLFLTGLELCSWQRSLTPRLYYKYSTFLALSIYFNFFFFALKKWISDKSILIRRPIFSSS